MTSVKTHFLLFVFGLAVFLPAFAESKADGLDLLVEACLETKRMFDDGVSRERYRALQRYAHEGHGLDDEMRALITEAQPLFDLIREAAAADHWTPLDPGEFTPSWISPVELTGWLNLQNLTAAQGRLWLEENQAEKALQLLTDMQVSADYLNVNGPLIHPLGASASRMMLAPLFLSTMEQIPEADLENLLETQRQRLANLSSATERVEGELHYGPNLIKQVFDDLRSDPDLETERKKLLETLKNREDGEAWIAGLEKHRLLSFEPWREQILKELDEFHKKFLEVLNQARPIPEKDWDKWTEARLNQIYQMQEADRTELLDTVTNLFPDPNEEPAKQEAWWSPPVFQWDPETASIEEVKAAHEAFGNRLTRKLLEIVTPTSIGIDRLFRKDLALERMQVIHMAARLYELRHGDRPESLRRLVEADLVDADTIIDPFTDTPLKLRITDDSPWRVYCVGKNLTDNGGVHDPELRRQKDDFLLPLKTNTPPRR